MTKYKNKISDRDLAAIQEAVANLCKTHELRLVKFSATTHDDDPIYKPHQCLTIELEPRERPKQGGRR